MGSRSADLFERMLRGMALTQAGRTLFHHAKLIEQRHLQAREAIEAEKSGHLDVLRVGAGPLFRRAYLAEAFDAFRLDFPDTRFELRADVHLGNIPRLKRGELDIVFGALVDELDDHDIATRKMTAARLGALARADHPLQSQPDLCAADIAEMPWILYSDDLETTTMVSSFFVRHGLRPPKFAVQATSYEFGLRLIRTGNYLMPAPLELNKSFESQGLSALPLSEPIDVFQAGAYFRKSALVFPALAKMIELVANFSGDTVT